jgi:uroporphyrinogen decarboxylase
MTSAKRVFTAISQNEPDRVPLCLMLTIHGAKELGISITDYYSKPANVVYGQMKMKEKYHTDIVNTFYYAPIEIEAFGGEVIFYENGPANSGEPFIKNYEQISKIDVPNVRNSPCLNKVLQTTSMLKRIMGEDTPIIGVVMSPYSLPVMQMGFEKYIDLLYNRTDDFNALMRINEEFCVTWANAQLEAGATAICYFDPLASPTVIERDLYLKTGFNVAKRTISRIKGPTATFLASGRSLPVINDLIETGTKMVGVSDMDDLNEVKKAANKRITIVGNLNGLDMIDWSVEKTKYKIREAISKGANGGGFILCDNHGEVPWYVPEEILLQISQTIQEWGKYPICEGE